MFPHIVDNRHGAAPLFFAAGLIGNDGKAAIEAVAQYVARFPVAVCDLRPVPPDGDTRLLQLADAACKAQNAKVKHRVQRGDLCIFF